MKGPVVIHKRFPAFWTLLTVLVVSGLMIVAAQTTGGTAGAAGAAAPSATAADPNAVVLKLGDQTFTAAQFEPRFNIALRTLAAQQGAPLDAATLAQFGTLRPNFLDQFATQQVLLQDAEKRGLSVPEAEVDAQLAQAKEGAGANFQQALTQAGYENEAALRDFIQESLTLQREVEALQSTIQVTPQAVRGFYDQNQEQFRQPEQVCARHILVADEAKANDLYGRLQDGANFAQLARNNSTDPGSKDNGGDLDCLNQGQTVPAFEEAAFGAEVGETVGPVQSEFGFHIIRVYKKNPGVVTPFAEARDQVRSQLVNERLGARIAELREASGIEVFPENLPQTAPAAPPAQPGAAPAAPAPATPEGEGE